jgi:hypothetical protein
MDAQTVQKISEQIYKKFPEVSGSRPKVQSQGSEGNSLLIFKGSAATADGKRIERTVRVVASDRGKIVKVTTSR